MASTQDINIRLSLVDKVSKDLSKVTVNFNEFGKSMDRVGKQISQVGMKMTYLGGAITGAFALSMKQAMEFSPAVNKTMLEIGNSFNQLNITIAQSVLPIFQMLSNALSNVVAWFKALDPQLRENILKWTLITGVVLTFGGVFVKVAGTVISLVGKIIAGINPWVLALMAVSWAVVEIITHWDNVRAYVMPIIHGVQIAVDMLAIGFNKVALAAAHSAAFMAAALGNVNVATKFEEQAIALEGIIRDLEADMTRAMSGNGLAEATDRLATDLPTKIKTMWDSILGSFKTGTESARTELFNFGTFAQNTMTQIGAAMSNSLGTVFFDVVKGKIASVQDAFASFGDAILQILTQALAKLILFQTVGMALAPTLGFNMFAFHQGGQVKRAHSGSMLSSDEVPIIAQAGEGIISRKGMNALGKGNFDSINRGDLRGGGSQTVNYYIMATDPQSFQQQLKTNKAVIHAVVEDNIRSNGSIRKSIQGYAR